MLVAVAAYAGGGGIPTPGPGKLSGPTTVCGGTSHTYTLSEGTSICLYGATFSVSNGTPPNPVPTTDLPYSFNVFWNNVSTNTTGQIIYDQQYGKVVPSLGDCDPFVAPEYSRKFYNVLIRPNRSQMPSVSPISSSIAQTNFIFSTSGVDATSYQWQVTSGGSIVGSSTGSSITVSANNNTCTINVRVRSVGTNCNNATIYSPWRSLSYSIQVPGRPTTPFGPQYIGAANFTKSFGTSAATATSFNWYVPNGSQFEIVGDNTRGSATVRCLTDNGTATTLY
ncbi:MAG TPA: hypothetical protein DCP28_29295, partial [Cytophagales bacterium]|nr:hypothetical protein [Cytophagales bacterium]